MNGTRTSSGMAARVLELRSPQHSEGTLTEALLDLQARVASLEADRQPIRFRTSAETRVIFLGRATFEVDAQKTEVEVMAELTRLQISTAMPMILSDWLVWNAVRRAMGLTAMEGSHKAIGEACEIVAAWADVGWTRRLGAVRQMEDGRTPAITWNIGRGRK